MPWPKVAPHGLPHRLYPMMLFHRQDYLVRCWVVGVCDSRADSVRLATAETPLMPRLELNKLQSAGADRDSDRLAERETAWGQRHYEPPKDGAAWQRDLLQQLRVWQA